MLSDGKVVVFLTGLLQFLAENMALLVQKNFKVKKRLRKSRGGGKALVAGP